jgi:guanine deaminase
MSESKSINILIAEDNLISRELMAGILKTQGYNIVPASDGTEAIDAVKKQHIDLALVDINMEPKGGFEFVRYLLINGIDIPVVIITADDSSDILSKASELGVSRVLQKPVEPDRLAGIVQRVLRQYGLTPKPLAVQTHETRYTHEQLMQRAVELAERNASSKKGGPFGAVVASADGHILGEGVNGISSRVDPTAHAEIMAIRQAAEKLGRADLSDCVLYCSSEPTMMGQALVISVGIRDVYFGLSHADIKTLREGDTKARAELTGHRKAETIYRQLGHDHALNVLKRWQAMKDKVAD